VKDYLLDLLAFVAGVILLLLIPRVMDRLDDLIEWWRRTSRAKARIRFDETHGGSIWKSGKGGTPHPN
jgi:hypothetical protein